MRGTSGVGITTPAFGSRGVGRLTEKGASVGVGLGVRVGRTFASDPPASFGATGAVPFNGTNGSYVGKAADVAGRGSQAEKQTEKSITVRVKRKKRVGMGAIVPNSLAYFPIKLNHSLTVLIVRLKKTG